MGGNSFVRIQASAGSLDVLMKGAAIMATETVTDARARSVSSDERWAAWVAKGVEHDRTIKKRAIAIASAIAAVGALSLVIFLIG